MRLLGTEAENDIRDLYTFQCAMCGKLEVRGVLVAALKLSSPHLAARARFCG